MFCDNRDLKPSDLSKKKKYHAHIRSTVEAFCNRFQPGKVVDIGCRDGYAVELLGDRGFDVCGTDLVEEYVKYARRRGRDVFFDDMMDSALPDNEFDYVFSRHCIEHCKDTELFLKTCARILKPMGCVFLTFPMETRDQWGSRKRNDHLVYFESKGAFRKENSVFKELYLGKSKALGIKPVGRELCFVGTIQG